MYPVDGGSVGVELDATRWGRLLSILISLFSYSRTLVRDPQRNVRAFVVVRNDTREELYREGPYSPSFATSEAKRYAQQVGVLGMDRALSVISREMNVRRSNDSAR